MAASTDIVKLDKYTLMKVDEDDLTEALTENVGDDVLSEFSFPTVKVPTGGGSHWMVPSATGGKPTPTEWIEGVVVAQKWTRVFWADKLKDGGSTPPDCAAPLGKVGRGFPDRKPGETLDPQTLPVVRDCSACPNSDWGTARNQDGTQGRGQACQKRKVIMLIPPTGVLPMIVNLAPTSGDNARDFFLGIMPLKASRAHIRIGLETFTKGGNDTAVAQFELLGEINDEFAERIKMIEGVFGRAFAASRVEAGDNVAAAGNGSGDDVQPV